MTTNVLEFLDLCYCRSIWTLWSHPSRHHLKAHFLWRMTHVPKWESFSKAAARGIGISHRQQPNQKFLTRVYLNRNGNATFHLRPSCWTLFHIWSQRKKPTVFGVCSSAGTTCDSSWKNVKMTQNGIISSHGLWEKKENGRMAVSSSFQTRTTCSKRLGNLAKTAFFLCWLPDTLAAAVQRSGSYRSSSFAGSFRWFYFSDNRCTTP